MTEQQNVSVFLIKDCALAAIATGLHAQNLRELRDHLTDIHLGCIYYHFWGGLLRPHFDDPEYNNDFASWARHALHDVPLAERLGINVIGRHTALGDAYVTGEVFLKMIPLLADMGILTLRQALDAAQKTYFARVKY